jgi:hypothetical protein
MGFSAREIPMKTRRSIVGQVSNLVSNLRPIGNRPGATPNVFSAGCGGLSTVQSPFSAARRARGALY